MTNEGGVLEIGIMTVHDVARYLRLSEAKVYKLARQGCLPAIRLGRSWRFKKDLIDEWMRKEIEGGLQVLKQR
jgi:excisionase family DNA binding protein